MSVYTWLRKSGKIIVATLVVAITIVLLSFFIRSHFRIQNIEIIGERVLVTIDQDKMPKNILFFPTEKIRQEILHDNVLLKDIIIQKKYPDTLVFQLYSRDAVAQLRNGNQHLLIDKNGYILGDVIGQSDLPMLEFNIEIKKSGDRIYDQSIVQAIAFIMLSNDDIHIEKITDYKKSYLIAETMESDILFPQSGDLTEKTDALQILISGFRIKGTLPKIIDLRFNKPVITM